MATTLMPLDPAVTPQRVSRPLAISASLLPQEITYARFARRVRTLAIIIVLLAMLLCAGWAALAIREKSEADSELTAATGEVFTLQREQDKYASVVKVRNDTELLQKQLKSVMANDLDWAALVSMLRSTGATAGVEVEGLNGKLDDAADGATGSSGTLPSTSQSTSLGSIIVTGTAPDKEAVALYVDTLGKQNTIANPYVTTVTATDQDGTAAVTFSISVDVIQTALCGRFGESCTATGGN